MKNLLFVTALAGLAALAALGLRDLSAAHARSSLSELAAAADAPAPPNKNFLTVRAAWLAERESAVGDWESVRPPLRAGDEVQLTVRADEDAFVYVISESEGERRVLFPAPGQPASLAKVRGGWQYGVPGRQLTWRLDGADHDRFVLVAARRPLADPLAALADAAPAATARRADADLELPLRDGRSGTARSRTLSAPDLVVDDFLAR